MRPVHPHVYSDEGSPQNELMGLLTRQIPSGFPNDINKVFIDILAVNDYSLRIRLTDFDNENRYEPPLPVPNLSQIANIDPNYSIDVDDNGNYLLCFYPNNKCFEIYYIFLISE